MNFEAFVNYFAMGGFLGGGLLFWGFFCCFGVGWLVGLVVLLGWVVFGGVFMLFCCLFFFFLIYFKANMYDKHQLCYQPFAILSSVLLLTLNG